MRVYLDTNALVHLLYDVGELSDDVYMTLSDYGNTVLTSSVCVHELIHLAQTDKVQRTEGKKRKPIVPETIVKSIDEAGISVVPVSRLHLETYAGLQMFPDHKDPNDRLIIAQAISDRAYLVSSDGKFSRYERFGLKLIPNER